MALSVLGFVGILVFCVLFGVFSGILVVFRAFYVVLLALEWDFAFALWGGDLGFPPFWVNFGFWWVLRCGFGCVL